MEQRPNEPTGNDSIDDLFEPILGDALDDVLDTDEPQASGKSRLVELRRRAEQRLEDKRIRDELSYMDLDWDDD